MALSFDGTNDKVDFGDIATVDGDKLTVCLWYTPTNTNALGLLWGKVAAVGGDANDLRLQHDDGAGGSGSGISWIHGTTSPRAVVATGVFTGGTTYHVALVYDGSLAAANRVVIYLDGVAQTLTITGTIPTTIVGSADTVTIGAAGDDTLDLAGTLSHLKVYDEALTQAEVLQEMNAQRVFRTADLYQWSPLDDGTSARDYSGSGNHGTVTGATQTAGPPVTYGGA